MAGVRENEIISKRRVDMIISGVRKDPVIVVVGIGRQRLRVISVAVDHVLVRRTALPTVDAGDDQVSAPTTDNRIRTGS